MFRWRDVAFSIHEKYKSLVMRNYTDLDNFLMIFFYLNLWGAPGLGCITPRQRTKARIAGYPDGPFPSKKIEIISCEPMVHIPDIKLIRRDASLDLSQTAKKGMH